MGGSGSNTGAKLMASMGSKIKIPKPPPLPTDEADTAPQASAVAQRAMRSLLGFRQRFMAGPRGPGGPAWTDPKVTEPTPPPKQEVTPTPPKPESAGLVDPSTLPTAEQQRVEAVRDLYRKRRSGEGVPRFGEVY